MCPWATHDPRIMSDAGCTVSPGDDVNPLNRSGIAAERPRSPSVSAPHRESLARPTGPGRLTYLIVPKVPKVPMGPMSPVDVRATIHTRNYPLGPRHYKSPKQIMREAHGPKPQIFRREAQ